MPTRLEPAVSKATIVDALTEARARTLLLVAPLSEADLLVQHDPLMSPIIWDLGHIAHFEDVWLVENVESGGSGSEGLSGVFNPFENPRAVRGGLKLPGLADCLRVMNQVRLRALERLGGVDFESDAPLQREGFVYHMVLQHEYQHNETILQTLQLKQGAPYPAPRAIPLPPARPLDSEAACDDHGPMVRFPGGVIDQGTDDRAVAYDNERPLHPVRVRPFWIDQTAVTNAQYLAFIEAGGYERREWWTEAGWAWREQEGLVAPKYWVRDGTGWKTRFMDQTVPVEPLEPVCHVCFYEADAFARFAGKRLPAETEWEAAASWDPSTGEKRRYPWGDDPPTVRDANLDQLTFRPAPVGAYPRNVSPIGCYGMIGDVWEWTASDFTGYPGFQSFPYREYSEVFFGSDYKVLRGGAWATRPGAIRNSFRNWDYPIRRQIFSGFRCARDA
ncbi:MAG: ergothioneine biosynthesis protein EgtB [Gemmatimonadales bacterium]